MDVELLVVPYDSGLRDWRMGAGPARLRAGMAEALQAAGHRVTSEWIEADEVRAPSEIRSSFELNRSLAERVRLLRDRGTLPVVLAGNCISAAGTLAGLSDSAPVVLWFDAHGDLHTPETTESGFMDGMALAAVTGRCWQSLCRRLPGYLPVPERKVFLIGARDLDPAEEVSLQHSEITWLPVHLMRDELAPALEEMRRAGRQAYVHLDLDVLDPSEGRVNGYAAPGGFSVREAGMVLEQIGRTFEVQAVAFSAYDPTDDAEGRICLAATTLLQALLGSSG